MVREKIETINEDTQTSFSQLNKPSISPSTDREGVGEYARTHGPHPLLSVTHILSLFYGFIFKLLFVFITYRFTWEDRDLRLLPMFFLMQEYIFKLGGILYIVYVLIKINFLNNLLYNMKWVYQTWKTSNADQSYFLS